MRLMTLNTHSLVEGDDPARLRYFVQGVLTERPDVIALQEVNQTIGASLAEGTLLTGYVPAQEGIPVRGDNHAAWAAALLREAGVPCGWTYLPVKIGYGRFDEGLAVLAPGREIARVEAACISQRDDYQSWRTRKALAVQVKGWTDWFCCVHMGWWQDEQEPFLAQWKALDAFAKAKARQSPVWLMGDFNAPAEVRGEGYDRIAADGWHDVFRQAEERHGSATIPGRIDGWLEVPENADAGGLRIDQIWCSQPAAVDMVCVLFDGKRHPVISDHYGVMAMTACAAATSETRRGAE